MAKKRSSLPAGITRRKDQHYVVRTTMVCPTTQKRKDAMRVLPPHTTLVELQRAREALRDDLRGDLARVAETARASPCPPPTTPPTAESITYADYAESWMARSRMRPATAEIRMIGLAHRVLPYIGQVQLSKITRAHIVSLREHLETVGKDHRQSTVTSWWRTAIQILRDALADFELRDCTQRLQGPSVSAKPPARTPEVLSRDQVVQLVELASRSTRHWGMVAILAYTGMRKGEALALRWCDVNMEEGVIHVCRSAVQMIDSSWQIEAPKSGNPRTVGIPPQLGIVLKRWREQHPGVGEALVTPGGGGKPMTRGQVKDAFARLTQLMDLGHSITPQVLRRSYVSISVAVGLDDALRRAMVGHSSPDLTDLYHQLMPDVAAASAAAMWESHSEKKAPRS